MKTKKIGFLSVVALILVLTGFSSQSNAGVDVRINLPAFRFVVPPPMVVIPGTYAYFAPDADIDIVFYQGYWYRPFEGRWYRGRGYNGPWVNLVPHRVPPLLMKMPHDYRHTYRDHHKIKYNDFSKNWRKWERSKYWDKDEKWRAGKVREHRHDRREDRREDRRDYRDGGGYGGHRGR